MLKGSAAFKKCPVCTSETIETPPVENNESESYSITTGINRDIEIELNH